MRKTLLKNKFYNQFSIFDVILFVFTWTVHVTLCCLENKSIFIVIFGYVQELISALFQFLAAPVHQPFNHIFSFSKDKIYNNNNIYLGTVTFAQFLTQYIYIFINLSLQIFILTNISSLICTNQIKVHSWFTSNLTLKIILIQHNNLLLQN